MGGTKNKAMKPGELVYYHRKVDHDTWETEPAKVLKVMPKTVKIEANTLYGTRTRTVRKKNVELQSEAE